MKAIALNGRFRHSFTWRMPGKFMLVSTSGFPEMENFESLSGTVRAQAYNFGSGSLEGGILQSIHEI